MAAPTAGLDCAQRGSSACVAGFAAAGAAAGAAGAAGWWCPPWLGHRSGRRRTRSARPSPPPSARAGKPALSKIPPRPRPSPDSPRGSLQPWQMRHQDEAGQCAVESERGCTVGVELVWLQLIMQGADEGLAKWLQELSQLSALDHCSGRNHDSAPLALPTFRRPPYGGDRWAQSAKPNPDSRAAAIPAARPTVASSVTQRQRRWGKQGCVDRGRRRSAGASPQRPPRPNDSCSNWSAALRQPQLSSIAPCRRWWRAGRDTPRTHLQPHSSGSSLRAG